jgi:hypothetical protein
VCYGATCTFCRYHADCSTQGKRGAGAPPAWPAENRVLHPAGSRNNRNRGRVHSRRRTEALSRQKWTEACLHPLPPRFIRVCDVCGRSDQPARIYYPTPHLELHVWFDSRLGLDNKVQIRLFTDPSSVKSANCFVTMMSLFNDCVLIAEITKQWMKGTFHKWWTGKHMRGVHTSVPQWISHEEIHSGYQRIWTRFEPNTSRI